MQANKAIDFISSQYDRQIDCAEYRLNVFEKRPGVPRRRCARSRLRPGEPRHRGRRAWASPVLALDACNRAVEDLRQRAASRSLPLQSAWADLSDWTASDTYDSVVSIGLLMFLDCAVAQRVMEEIERAVRPSGVCALNVLVEGTTFMKMFDENAYCLFAHDALLDRCAGWTVLDHRIEEFETPEPGSIKRFATLIARRPAAAN